MLPIVRIILVATLAGSPMARADLFTPVPSGPGAIGAVFDAELDALRASLASAPAFRPDASLDSYALPIALPGPDGVVTDCLVAEASVMEPPLQARYPQIRSYIVQSVDHTAVGRFDLTPGGLSAMLRTPVGTWMIDPLDPRRPERGHAYWLHDLRGSRDWPCHTLEGPSPLHGFPTEPDDAAPGPFTERAPSPKILRTVRLAMACTGEYGWHQCERLGHTPNVVDPLAAIVTTVSRTNVVYEGDLGVHFTLVGNNDGIVFIDPATDPYPATCDGSGGEDCSGIYLNANVTTLNNAIGAANYDVGHLLTRVYGGVAYLSSLCNSNKAGGISGLTRGGDVEELAFLVVVHELGHQFGAAHTFSGTRGRCGGTGGRNSAWEAGSGSSPMAYPGGCPVGDAPPSDNVALFADPYFHHGSVTQINSLLRQVLCPVEFISANTPPEFVFVSPNLAIPPGTPFELSALAVDSDGDVLTYSWEQFDGGVARPISGVVPDDTGFGALFRIFPPVREIGRDFPRMQDVLSGVPTPGEQLPTSTGAIRHFRCIVRDNYPGVGAATISLTSGLEIATGASPFRVTSPGAGAVLNPGVNIIAWSVGNTDAPPISCGTVTILMSKDDGLSFDTALGSFPNTGSASVSLPGAIASARVRINGDENVFFAVSPRFEVLACPGDFNRSGSVTVQDVFDYLSAWFTHDPMADVNASSGVTIQDIFDFLERWFVGCG